MRVEYFQGAGEAYIFLNWQVPHTDAFGDAVAAAKAADVALVFVGTTGEGEGNDRPSMDLPGAQDGLIRAVAAANKRTVVVLNNGTPVTLTGWLDQVPGLVDAYFPGEEGGRAIASVLFGDVNPSGKLPDTLAAKRTDYPDLPNFPGKNGSVTYAEGIYVGYRHFDKQKIDPIFPFGYGLSYTTFKYGNIKLSSPTLTGAAGTVTATVEITNTGKRAGAEVVELYVHDPSPQIDKPVRELKGFQKVELAAGQTKAVTFTARRTLLRVLRRVGQALESRQRRVLGRSRSLVARHQADRDHSPARRLDQNHPRHAIVGQVATLREH